MALTKLRPAGQGFVNGPRNLIINGDMQCWQRTTAATAVTNAYATVDRFRFVEGTAGAYTSERSTDSPIGTGYSLKLQVTTADASMASGDYAYFQQVVEAQNLQPLQYGTSSAKTLTLSFWVKSSKTGTYAIALIKADSTQYNFVHEYTISSANTWEKKTITISPTAGSTSFITSAAGGINNDTGVGFYVVWMLCSGTDLNGATNNAWSSNGLHYTTTNQVNWMDSTSNNFYLAQAQLEIGDVATDFEHEDIGTTLRKCKRYYEFLDTNIYPLDYSNQTLGNFYWTEQKRVQPTLSVDANSGSVSLYPTYTSGGYIYSGSKVYNSISGMRGDSEL